MSDPLRPPRDKIIQAIESAARRLTKLQAKRSKLVRAFADIEGQIRQARAELRALVDDQLPHGPSPLTDDEPLVP